MAECKLKGRCCFAAAEVSIIRAHMGYTHTHRSTHKRLLPSSAEKKTLIFLPLSDRCGPLTTSPSNKKLWVVVVPETTTAEAAPQVH